MLLLSVYTDLPCCVLDCTTGKKTTKVEEKASPGLAASSETPVRLIQGKNSEYKILLLIVENAFFSYLKGRACSRNIQSILFSMEKCSIWGGGIYFAMSL